MDCSKEALLDELSDFERQKPVEIPAVLEEYLREVAKTGDTLFPWHRMKPLLCRKLEVVMNEFYQTFPTDSLPILPNVEAFNYDDMKSKILETLDTFTSAPFTIQRLCELVVDPRKHYKRTDKFMRGVEKNVLVVSTVEPKATSPIPLQQQCSTPMVNGLPGIEDSGINGHIPGEPDSVRAHTDKTEERRVPAVSEAVDGVPALEDSRACNGTANTPADSKESSKTVLGVPGTATETPVSQVEAKECDSGSRDLPDIVEPSAENVIGQCSEEVVADQIDAEEKKDCAVSEMSSTESAQHSKEVPSSARDVEISSEPKDAAPVEDVAESCDKIEEATSVEASTELEKGLHEESADEPPHKKFHADESESQSGQQLPTALEQDIGSAADDTAVVSEEPIHMVENGKNSAETTESMETNGGPSDASSTDDISDVTEVDTLPSQAPSKEEPMDQD